MEKWQHVTTYKIYQTRESFKIVSISDLHFSSKVTNERLVSILKTIRQITPSYIFITGDIVDSLNEIEKEEDQIRLTTFMRQLSNIGEVCFILGNHDFYIKKKQERKNGIRLNNLFFDKLSTVKHIHYLNNDKFEDEKIYVAGINLPPTYYKIADKSKVENKQILLETLKEEKKILESLPINKIKFLLIHSPIYLKEEKVEQKLSEFDYYLAGHMHSGCVPPGLDEIWKSSKGIISPYKTLFPENTRNTLNNKEDKLIVNRALTTLQACTKFRIFNFLFPIYHTEIEITNDKNYNTEKIRKKTKYYMAK